MPPLVSVYIISDAKKSKLFEKLSLKRSELVIKSIYVLEEASMNLQHTARSRQDTSKRRKRQLHAATALWLRNRLEEFKADDDTSLAVCHLSRGARRARPGRAGKRLRCAFTLDGV